VLFYKSSIFKIILVAAGGMGRLPDPQVLLLFLLECGTNPVLHILVMKFLMVPGNSNTICRSEDGVSPSP